MCKYLDKNKKEIKAGMSIRHIDGDIEKIYANADGTDIGVNATNPNYKGNNMRDEIYPLSQFCMSEWEIIDEAGPK